MSIFPAEKHGVAAVILPIVGIILFVVGSVLPYVEVTGLRELLRYNPLQVAITLLIFLCAVCSAILALHALIRKKDKAILLYLALIPDSYLIISFFGMIVQLSAMLRQ